MSTETRTLYVLPDDGIQPLLSALDAARKTVLIKMFLFSEPRLLDAVIAANKRGVKARVMLNPERKSGQSDNDEAKKKMSDAGVDVKDTHSGFEVTHEKSMVVDGTTAFVMSHNWAPKNFGETRDYGVITSDPGEVAEIVECFEEDWKEGDFKVHAGRRLIWCRGGGRERLAKFVDGAKTTLFLQNERYQDPTLIERLVHAKSRGVKVHVMSLPPHALKDKKLLEGVAGLRMMRDVGVKVHKLKDLHMHAKLMVADGERAIVGSMNIAPGSFDDRRELAIELDDKHVLKRLVKTFETDWENSKEIDLTDEGIQADLEKHGREAKAV